ncbi:sigma-54 interaction domain-containing protein [Priestia megaterium]|uniref:sigma-54 interaction domain-containing protein n=1 Tax=Priestia megaterium TaxID=1404 RepID=UPI0027955FA6|nr:sigma 54-interacting transcriptional regulator [Priestia megaterium]
MKNTFQEHIEVDCSSKKFNWWHAVINSINDGILVIDKKGIVRFINPEYTKITGVKSDIIGKPLIEYRPGAQLTNTLKDQQCRVGVYRKEKNREYMVDMAPIIIEGKVAGAVSVCKSLNEVDKLSKELRRQTEKLKNLENRMDSIYEAKYTFEQIIGGDGGLRHVVHIAEKVAESQFPILVTGESGTGKELFSQAIHNKSERKHGPFIPVNCAAIPSSLLESELFGYGDGAFTNAKKGGKAGLFEIADNGTIFLDEIGDMSYDLQAKLLRVLQEKKIRRVGEATERAVDVRIIAATHRNLKQLVNKKQFREDLFYRLNVIQLEIPPLRKRREDIRELVYSFIKYSTTNTSYKIDEYTLGLLQSYHWPGNVRELKNVIDYATCMAEDTDIVFRHLPEFMIKNEKNFSDIVSKTEKSSRTLQEAIQDKECAFIQEILRKYPNNIEGKKKAAEVLDISLATLYNKMKKYHIHF